MEMNVNCRFALLFVCLFDVVVVAVVVAFAFAAVVLVVVVVGN